MNIRDYLLGVATGIIVMGILMVSMTDTVAKVSMTIVSG